MEVQNLIYALIQVVHNFGAATVVGSAAAALWLARGNAVVQHRLAVLAAIGWAVQGASGTTFGITTYSFEGHLPDIHGVAVIALLIKMACAAVGFVTAIIYIRRGLRWPPETRLMVWLGLFALAFIALSAAAFLRWFS